MTEKPAFEPAVEPFKEEPAQEVWTPMVEEPPVGTFDMPAVEETPVTETIDAPPETVEPIAEVVDTPQEIVEPVAEVVDAPQEIVEPVAEVVDAPQEIVEPVAEVIDAPQETVEPVAEVIDAPQETVEPVVEEQPAVEERPAVEQTPAVEPSEEDKKLSTMMQQAEDLKIALQKARSHKSTSTSKSAPAIPQKKQVEKAVDDRRRRVLLGKHATKTITADSGTVVVEAGAEVTEEVLQRARLSNKFIELSMNVQ